MRRYALKAPQQERTNERKSRPTHLSDGSFSYGKVFGYLLLPLPPPLLLPLPLPDRFVYWLIPSGLLTRERPEVPLLLLDVPRPDELLPPRDEDDELAVPRLDELLLRDEEELLFVPD